MATREMEQLVIGGDTYVIRDNDAVHNESEHVTFADKHDGWTFRVWSQGRAECWGNFQFNVTEWKTWGGLYYSYPYFQKNYPGIFNAPPTLLYTASAQSASKSGIMTVGVEGVNSQTKTPSLYIMRPDAGATGTYILHIYAIGESNEY